MFTMRPSFSSLSDIFLSISCSNYGTAHVCKCLPVTLSDGPTLRAFSKKTGVSVLTFADPNEGLCESRCLEVSEGAMSRFDKP